MDLKQCRTCLTYSNLRYIFIEDDVLGSISTKIMELTSVTIDIDDNLPQHICADCYNKLKSSYEFKAQCKRSDESLRKLYLQSIDSAEENLLNDDDTDVEIKIEMEDSNNMENASVVSDNECQKLNNKKSRKKTKRTMKKNNETATSAKPANKIVKARSQCSVCGKLISSEFRLKCHMRVHTGEKPFKCKDCNRQFSLAYNLKIHERIHTGEKPLMCGICGKCFAQSASLVTHMRLHTGEKPYKCNLCPMTFITCSNLTYHLRMHKGEKNFICGTCQRGFVAKGDLTQHMRTHSGERLFVCSICGLKLSRNYHLTRHMTTHTGEKNFRCQICGNAYTQKSDLTRHMKKNHQLNVLEKNHVNVKTNKMNAEMPITIKVSNDQTNSICA